MLGVEAQIGIGMKDGRLGKPMVRKSDEAWPSDPVLLTATPKRAHPTANHLQPKTAQTGQIPRNSIIVEVALDYRSQPFPKSATDRCLRLRSSSFSAFSLAESRLWMVLRKTRNLPRFQVCPEMWVKPRKLNVSGLPSPRSFRALSSATSRRFIPALFKTVQF